MNGEQVELLEVWYDVGAVQEVQYESCGDVLDGLESMYELLRDSGIKCIAVVEPVVMSSG